MDLLIECTLVFLVPIFLALTFNRFFRKNNKANLKIVYYKIFTFLLIIYLASQVLISCEQQYVYLLRIFGDFLLGILIFELFILPDDTTESSDIIIAHEMILWVVALLLLFNCFKNFKHIQTDSDWDDIKLYRLDKVFSKISKSFSVSPNEKNVELLPICNLFSCYKILSPTNQL